ncbi:MAG: hypothetical protein ROO76_11890 [Terriglobia bacterium]|jgi:hypothetical protein|nr:hypothetical protein [Terriglobia bacterium]
MATPDRVHQLIIQYRLGTGTVDDFDRRVRVEELMIECLGREGLGYCDGGDMGDRSMNVFCFVNSVERALPAMVQALATASLQEGAVIAITVEDSIEVLWPDGFAREFVPL